eukprot:Pgem_evm1s6877
MDLLRVVDDEIFDEYNEFGRDSSLTKSFTMKSFSTFASQKFAHLKPNLFFVHLINVRSKSGNCVSQGDLLWIFKNINNIELLRVVDDEILDEYYEFERDFSLMKSSTEKICPRRKNLFFVHLINVRSKSVNCVSKGNLLWMFQNINDIELLRVVDDEILDEFFLDEVIH